VLSLSVQTKKTVRISTNYRIEDAGNDVDSQIEAYLYETLKPVLTQNITLATFIDRDNHTGGSIVSSQKVVRVSQTISKQVPSIP